MKFTFFSIIVLFATTLSFSQTEVSGIELPDTFEVGETSLDLNGAGVREKFWMDLYVGGLYTDHETENAQEVINSNAPMALKIHMVSGLISSGKMSSAVEDGFENSTDGHMEPHRVKIDKFKSFFSNEISEDDVFDITYSPSEGVVVFKNNKELGTIEGLDFKKALFGIWFCDKPADKDLMKGMLNI